VTNIQRDILNVYVWAVTINGYTERDTVVVINSSFEISAGDDIETCFSTTTLAAEPPGAGGTGTWSVLIGSGSFTDLNAYNTDVTNLSAGSNQLRWTVVRSSGCMDSDELNIIFHQPQQLLLLQLQIVVVHQ
jgi:hypothetical protein